MKRSRLLALVAIGAAVIGTALLQPPATAQPQSAAASTATIWEDDFDGPSGQAPDPAKWRYDIGGNGWGNNELEYYTNSTRNSALDGQGNLVITARQENGGHQCPHGPRPYTSARPLTPQTVTQTHRRVAGRS